MSKQTGKKNSGKQNSKPSGSRVSLRRNASGDSWIFGHPKCVREMGEDMEEVHAMIESGEPGLAMDELLWLVSECRHFMDAHRLLGELALQVEDDVQLARGHYAFAYELGLKALKRASMPSPIPHRHPANEAFFEAGIGLSLCLTKLGKPHLAEEIRDLLLKCDPEFPMGCE